MEALLIALSRVGGVKREGGGGETKDQSIS